MGKKDYLRRLNHYMKPMILSGAILAMFTLLSKVSSAVEPSDPSIRCDLYDYSSPEASFHSFQKAITSEDLEGVFVHLWFILKGTIGVPEATNTTTFSGLVESYRSRKNFSCAAIDASAIEDGLEITKAKFVEEVSRKQQKEYGGFTVCRFLVEWPETRKQAHLETCKFDSAKDWWFWPEFGGYRVKTFDIEGDEKK